MIPEPASALIQQFAEAASAVLSQIANAELNVQPVVLDDAIDPATLLSIEVTGAIDARCEIALSAPMTNHFAALLTGDIPDPTAEITGDLREAAAELFQQICGNAADRLRRIFGPLEIKSHPASRDSASGARQLILVTRQDDTLEFEFHILHSTAAEPPVPSIPPPEPTPAAAPSATPSHPPQPPPAPAFGPAANRNLDLLLDIELGVTLRFGTRQMLLKDILELCSGSVVELDRRVQEPVDLLIDGRLIAHGEVVIVEGNYGLRILHVASQGEKIACLP